MKKVFVLFTALLSLTLLHAQGNLQFNQVMLMSNGQSTTVPAGKVWKVVSMTAGDGINYGDDVRFFITLNGVQNHLIYLNRSQSYADRTNTAPALPLWIPGGTTVAIPTYGGTGSTTRIRNISIIEFNIIE